MSRVEHAKPARARRVHDVQHPTRDLGTIGQLDDDTGLHVVHE
jgi:hypothetical protein